MFLNLSTAYSRVDFKTIYNKFKTIKVRCLSFLWIKSFMCGRPQMVQVASRLSEVKFGVPQVRGVLKK